VVGGGKYLTSDIVDLGLLRSFYYKHQKGVLP
jgi:hypothetical protein